MVLSSVALEDIYISIPVYREEDIVPTKLPYIPASQSGLSNVLDSGSVFNIAPIFSPGSKFYGYTYETAGRFISETSLTMANIPTKPNSWKNYFKCSTNPSEQAADVVCRSQNTSSNTGFNQGILRIKDGGTILTPILTAYTVVKYSPDTKEQMLGDDGIPVVVSDESGKSLNVEDNDTTPEEAMSSTQFRLSLATLISLLLTGIGMTALFYALPRNDNLGTWGSGVIFIILILSSILGLSARFWFKEGTNVASYITGLSVVNIIGTVLVFLAVIGLIAVSYVGGESMKDYTPKNTNNYVFTIISLLVLGINQILSFSYTSSGIKNDSINDYKDGYSKQPLFHFTVANLVTYLPKFFLAMSLVTSGPLTNIFNILRVMYLFTSPDSESEGFRLPPGSGIPTNLTTENIQEGIENIVKNIQTKNPLSASTHPYSAQILAGLETTNVKVIGEAGGNVPTAYIVKNTLGKIFGFFTTKKIAPEGSGEGDIIRVITSEITRSADGGDYKVNLPPTPEEFSEIKLESLLSSKPGSLDFEGTPGFIMVLALVVINLYFTLSKSYAVSQKEDARKRRSILTMDAIISLIILFVLIYYFGGGIFKNGLTYGLTTGTFIITAAIPVIQQIVNLIGS
jgi:heme/copper-type cytochrome/quinol oxidase subunit 2